nr:zinc-dependent metalloprotease [Chitinophagaceae bacterium]
LLTTIDPKSLRLPDTLLRLIPPRPAGYDFSPELFTKKTGLAFDALSPAEAAADMVISLLFHPERLSRMVQYESTMDGLPLDEMMTIIRSKIMDPVKLKGMDALIQQQNEQILLTYLMAATQNEEINFAARAIIKKHLEEIKTATKEKAKATTDPYWKGHYLLALQRMEKPELAKPTVHATAPPGAPIGCD